MIEPTQSPSLHLHLAYTGVWSLAQLGMIRALEEEGYRIGAVTASGLGALVGALWACESDLQLAPRVLARLAWEHAEEQVETWLDLLLKGKTLSELDRECAIAVANLSTGERKLVRSGSLARAVRSSLGIAGWLSPVQHEDGLLADPGLWMPEPSETFVTGPSRRRVALHIRGAAAPGSQADMLMMQLNMWTALGVAGTGLEGPRVVLRTVPSSFGALEDLTAEVYRATKAWVAASDGTLHANG